jgi:hypothetical protein
MVESVRWTRLKWRLRGAWQWPAFGLLTAADVALLEFLPAYGDGPDLWGATLASTFYNLFAVAVGAPFVGMLLRLRRRDLPRMIARDYAGAALLVMVTTALLLGGIAHA